MGNGIKGGRYWEEEEKRRCRKCGGEEETWEHVWENCVEWIGCMRDFREGEKWKGLPEEMEEWKVGEI